MLVPVKAKLAPRNLSAHMRRSVFVAAEDPRNQGHEQVVHIAGVGIQSRINNNRVERLHNTMREREKVMRHLKRAQSAEKILKGFRAYYNFVRPHMALENHTPAEMAAIPIELGTNRWLDLIRQAARYSN
jgi:transposase-like protein